MIGCIVQARMGSSRLPGKVMRKIDKQNTVLDYVIKQLKSANKIKKILVATTDLAEDDVIYDYSTSRNIECYRGSSEDVLDRYYQCAKKFSVDTIIRITADNPLIDPNVVDLVVDEYEKHSCDFATNTIRRTFPYGTEVEVFSLDVLEIAWNKAKKPSEREHVTPFIRDPRNGFKLFSIEQQDNFSHIRYTVDKIEDLNVVKEIVKNVASRPILTQDIINLYKNKPEIFEMNRNVEHDGYLTALKKDEQYLKSQKDNGVSNV